MPPLTAPADLPISSLTLAVFLQAFLVPKAQPRSQETVCLILQAPGALTTESRAVRKQACSWQCSMQPCGRIKATGEESGGAYFLYLLKMAVATICAPRSEGMLSKPHMWTILTFFAAASSWYFLMVRDTHGTSPA